MITKTFLSQPRALYAAVFVWLSVVCGRFLAPFLEHEANLSDFQIGMLLSSFQLVSVASSFVSGSFADKMEAKFMGRGRALVLAVSVGLGSLFLLLHGMSHFFEKDFFDYVYWYGTLRISTAISSSFIFPAMDAICLEYLKSTPGRSPQEYGKERLYGAISWAVVNVGLGFYLDSTEGDFAFVIYPLTIASTALVWAITFAHSTRNGANNLHGDDSALATRDYKKRSSILQETDQEPLEEETEDIFRSKGPTSTIEPVVETERISPSTLLGTLCISWFGLSFIVCTVALSSGQAVVDQLVFLYFEFLGSTYTVMGLTVVLTVAFEIPIFHVAPKLLEDWGAGMLLMAAVGCYVTRVIGYSLIPEGKVVWVLLLEPLHGVTFACASSAGVEVLSQLTPRGSESTAQSLLQLFVGAGSVMGLSFGGWALEALGPRTMYRLEALVVLLGGVIFGSVLFCSGGEPAAATATTSRTHRHQALPQDDLEMTSLSHDILSQDS